MGADMTPKAMAAYMKESTAKSGVPMKVKTKAVLRRVALLLS